MQKIKKFLIPILVFSILIVPVLSFAQGQDPSAGNLIPCNNTPDAKGVIAKPCDFKALMGLINNVIKFVLFKLALPIAAVMFFYAGFKMVTSAGSTEARGTAKKVFSSTVIGLVVAVGGWLIIRTILSILGYQGDWIGF